MRKVKYFKKLYAVPSMAGMAIEKKQFGTPCTLREALAVLQATFLKPLEEGTTIELKEEDLLKVSESIKEDFQRMFSWGISEEEGKIKIFPVNGDCITIHGEEEALFFICRLLDYFQTA